MKKVKVLFILIATLIAFSAVNSCNQKTANIPVGVVAPLSGDNASYGTILKQGFDLAFSSDTSIKLQYEDSKFDPTTAVSAINKLISVDKVQVVLGEVASGVTMAIAPVAEKNKVVLFSTISSTDNLRNSGPYFFRNIPRNEIQGKTVAQFLYNKLNIKSVAFFGMNDEYGTNISKSFKETFMQLGGKVVFEDFFKKGDVDFRTALSKIKSSGAKALFIPGDKNEPAGILKQAKELNLNIPIVGGDGSCNSDVISIAGNSSEGFYCANVLVNPTSAYYQNYHRLFVDKYHKEPGAYDAYAYEGGMILLEAIHHSGNDANKVKDYLHSHTFQSMTGDLKFDKDGEVNRLWGMYQVVNGKFIALNNK
jgi:branched-chain amino acid transport system substrate-binding protein